MCVSEIYLKSCIGHLLTSSESALYMAAKQGDLAALRDVVQQSNADISTQNPIGNSPLHLACENGHSHITTFIVDELLRQTKIKALRIKNKNGFEPIHIAFSNGHKEIAYYIATQYFKVKRCRHTCAYRHAHTVLIYCIFIGIYIAHKPSI